MMGFFASALKRGQEISLPFLPLLPTLYGGSESPMWADAVLCSALQLRTSPTDLSLLLHPFALKDGHRKEALTS